MTEPTQPPPGPAGISSDDHALRLRVLDLAVRTREAVPAVAVGADPVSELLATRITTDAILDSAKKYLAWLEGEGQ